MGEKKARLAHLGKLFTTAKHGAASEKRHQQTRNLIFKGIKKFVMVREVECNSLAMDSCDVLLERCFCSFTR